MRFVVIDIAASSGGAMSVLKEFYAFVKENDQKNEWIFFLGDHYFEETERISIRTFPTIKHSRLKKLCFDLFRGKKVIADCHPDAVLSLQNTSVFGVNVPQIVYVHQSIPFQKTVNFSFLRPGERSLAVYQYLIGSVIKQSIKIASKVVVQTQWMKSAIVEQVRKDENDIIVIPPTVRFRCEKIVDGSWSPCSFIYPAFDAIYKNIRCIDQAVRKIRQKTEFQPEVTVTVPQGSYSELNCVGILSRDQVMQAYAEGILIFPSYIETFGLPLLEARETGTVILASDCAFSREVLKNYHNAYFFNPFRPDDLAALMCDVMSGRIRRKTVISKAQRPDENGWSQLVSLLEEIS